MSRYLAWAAFPWLIVASLAGAQAKQEAKALPAVVELLEDGTDFLIQHLDNNGGEDGSVAERSEPSAFSGDASLLVSTFQRFTTQVPGWKYPIAENPEPGQFRYLRFAWKRTEAPGIMLQLFAPPRSWHRYYAGSVSQQAQSWGAMTRVAAAAPQEWELVTRDLFKDFGPMTITGIGFTALEGPGHAYYDHIYLGRTIEDLDRVTATRKNVTASPAAVPTPAGGSGRFWAVVLIVMISLAGFLGLALALWLRGSKADPEAKERGKTGRRPHKSTEP